MIILEGTDNVGKTTMAQTLCEIVSERTGLPAPGLYGHMSRPPADFDHGGEYFRNVRLGVQDRYHLGSIVYGRILGGGTFPHPRKMRVVQAYLRWMGCHVVIVTCQRDALRERLTKSVNREEMYRLDQILDAGDAYSALARSSNGGEPYCDEAVDVTRGWPGRKELEAVVDRWHRKFIL
jgi:hypothetical protein